MKFGNKMLQEWANSMLVRKIEWQGNVAATADDIERYSSYLKDDGLMITGFDSDGLTYDGDGSSDRGIRPDVVTDVASLLRELKYACPVWTGIGAKLPKTRHESYYLKHVFENLRRRKGKQDYYVSNGEFIAGYIHFLCLEFMGKNRKFVRKCISIDGLGGPNVDVAIPEVWLDIADRFVNPGRYTLE